MFLLVGFGCRFWLSVLAVGFGCRFWLSVLAVGFGCRFWLSVLAVGGGGKYSAALIKFDEPIQRTSWQLDTEGGTTLLSIIEESRTKVAQATQAEKKSMLGQFLTPATTAQFMAGLFVRKARQECHLLDAGAGIGSLSAAFLERCGPGNLDLPHVAVDAFEIDESLHPYLNQTLEGYRHLLTILPTIRSTDFIEAATDSLSGSLFANVLPKYTHAILNPPYKKIRNDSMHRIALRRVGIETVNLYSAFVALSLSLLDDQGQLVAIIPRSFCNGPYYRLFRQYVLQRAAIRHIHLFDSRDKAFKDDGVLQENVIIMLERSVQQKVVVVTTSTDDTFIDLKENTYPFDRIVRPGDLEQFIHVPTSTIQGTIETSTSICHSLEDIGIQVSTGPVVDFRMKEHLRNIPEEGTVPLLYPGHFVGQSIEWPKGGMKKANAILRNVETEKWLYPNGHYSVVRRFSSKEEKRRITSSVVEPEKFHRAEMLGFENHLNVFHERRQGLPRALAFGLTMFLNSTAVDEYFRRSSGHTQVNATDLKMMKYPSREALIELGMWAMRFNNVTQIMNDEQVESMCK